MVEALVALGVGGSLRLRQQGDELVGHEDGVFHLILGGAGVDVDAVDGEGHGGGVEVLVLDLAQLSAVHGIGGLGGEFGGVKVVGTLAHSSSGVKQTATVRWGTSGWASRYSQAVTISATPALSSAPSSVVPSVTMSSCPT